MKKTFTYLTTILFLLIGSNMNSQGIQWLKKYEPVYTDIAPSPNSDLIVGAVCFSGTSTYDSYNLTCNGYYNSSISKINPSGNVSLIKNFTDSMVTVSRIAVDRFSNIFCVGTFTGTAVFDTFTLTGQNDPYETGFLIKMNSAGNVQWAQTINRYAILIPVMRTDQVGNLYLASYFGSTLAIGSNTAMSAGDDDGFIVKFDPNGTPQWLRTLGGSGEDKIVDITVDSQNNIYAVGHFSSSCAFGPNNLNSSGPTDAFICKLSSSGNFLWAKKYGCSADDFPRGIMSTGGDKLYTVGFSSGNTSIGSTTVAGGFKEYIAKFDTAGTGIWAKEFSGGGFCTFSSITSDGSDVVYTGGFFTGNLCFGSTTNTTACLNSGGPRHGFISKLDGSGNYLWVKEIKTPININWGPKIVCEQYGKLFASGVVSSSTVTSLSVETFNTTGDNRTSYFLRINPSVIGLNEYSANDETVVYPNPVHNNGTITICDNEILNNASVSISNLLGQTVFETKVQGNEIQLRNSGIVPGVYFLKVSSGSKTMLNKKIVVE